jgi:hypothetical protein
MMEGYFVRTLGMHRVYNSAFMNLLRDEDNQHYRGLLKQTMEFDPGIMKRYVNFMSNPDERTAIDQFGTGDKCFGIATLMATLPGLPMFGHGQVEGFTEKYGMEYQRPRYDETPEATLAALLAMQLALCGEREFSALRLLERRRNRGRKCLRLLQCARRTTGPGALSQSLRRDTRDDSPLDRFHR